MSWLQKLFITVLVSCMITTAFAQTLPQNFTGKVSDKAKKVSEKIDKKTRKALMRLQKQEEALLKKLSSTDSTLGEFSKNSEIMYKRVMNLVKDPAKNLSGAGGEYLPYLDSLQGSLSFLQNYDASLGKIAPENLQKALAGIKELESKFKSADYVKQFIAQRKQSINTLLSRYTSLPKGIMNNLRSIEKEAYYYTAQIREYKEMFRNPEKLEQQALTLLNKLPAFRKFMEENSQLTSIFRLPGNSIASTSQTQVMGLQTRSQVMATIQTQQGMSAANAQAVVNKNITSAQGAVDQIRTKLNQLGAGGGDLDMPHFKPNNQKTKTFFQRLEYGTNLQTTKGTGFFPITTDVGLTVGYKLNDKNVIGIGASYKIGWGKDIRHINVTSEGTGFRSFVDINIKRSFFLSGGFEYNYQQPFNAVQQLYNLDDWQKSGLIGLSKIVSLRTKVFKKTKVQLLWDFLSYNELPRTQPFKFRIGYSF